jgi:hypothetical protein
MTYIEIFRAPAIALALFICSACSYADTSKKNSSSSPDTLAALNCPEVIEFLTAIGSKKIYSQTLEEFMQSSAALIKVSSEKTVDIGGQLSREVDFIQSNNGWLKSAHSSYSEREKKYYFDRSIFQFNPGCFKSPDEFVKLAKLKVGKGFKNVSLPPPDGTYIVYEWEWADSDINNVRRLQLTASSKLYQIKAMIEPAPTEP